jgi:hypothetical protein
VSEYAEPRIYGQMAWDTLRRERDAARAELERLERVAHINWHPLYVEAQARAEKAEAELATTEEALMTWSDNALRAEAAIARVRELCTVNEDVDWNWNTMSRRDVLRALDAS